MATFFLTFLVPWVYMLAMLPAFGVGILGVKAAENDNIIGLVICGVITTLYTYIILSVWSLLVFGFFGYHHYEFDINYIPLLLWGYSIATGPFFYMASKDPANDTNIGSSLGCFFLMFIYIIFCINLLLNTHFLNLIILIILALCFSSFQTAIITAMAIEEKRNNDYYDGY